MRSRTAASLGALGLLGLATAAVVFARASDDELQPGPAGATLYPQVAHSFDNGVTIRALGATFSGTETVLNLTVENDGRPQEFRIPSGSFAGEGFGPGTTGAVSLLGDGSAVVTLPPVIKPGDIVFRLSAIQLVGHDERTVIEGNWSLTLHGPDRASFATAMEMEVLEPASVEVRGETVILTGRRSTSRTVIEYSVPPQLRELVAPRIVVDGVTYAAIGGEVGPAANVASFPATRMGASVRVELGPFAEEGSSEPEITVDLASIMQRAGRETGEFVLVPEDILAGREDLVVSVAVVQRDEGELLGRSSDDRARPSGKVSVLEIELAGNWHPQRDPGSPGDPFTSTPTVFDANGFQLFRMSSQVSYSKDLAGNIGSGFTFVHFWIEPQARMDVFTLVLGNPSRVISGQWSAELAVHDDR